MIVVVSNNIEKLEGKDYTKIDSIVLVNYGQEGYQIIKNAVVKVAKTKLFAHPNVVSLMPPIPSHVNVPKELLKGIGLLYDKDVEVL